MHKSVIYLGLRVCFLNQHLIELQMDCFSWNGVEQHHDVIWLYDKTVLYLNRLKKEKGIHI